MDPIVVAIVLALFSALLSLGSGILMLFWRSRMEELVDMKKTMIRFEGDIRVLGEQRANLVLMLNEMAHKMDELNRKMDEYILTPRNSKGRH